jgi:DNA-binding transcriptional regulator LsrR (DeoR family)
VSGELRIKTRVARMYHEPGLPQRAIAARLSRSQSRVSGLLRVASAWPAATPNSPPAPPHCAAAG